MSSKMLDDSVETPDAKWPRPPCAQRANLRLYPWPRTIARARWFLLSPSHSAYLRRRPLCSFCSQPIMGKRYLVDFTLECFGRACQDRANTGLFSIWRGRVSVVPHHGAPQKRHRRKGVCCHKPCKAKLREEMNSPATTQCASR